MFPWLTQNTLRPEVTRLNGQRKKLQALLAGDLDFHGANQDSPVHRIHPFPAKFPPALPRLFIQHLTAPGARVLDPMMGSGTTLLEARHLGRIALGNDIDPLALCLVEAKMAPISPDGLLAAARRVVEEARRCLETPHALKRLEQQMDTASQEFVDYWFLPRTRHELLALQQAILAESHLSTRRWLQILFSGIIIAKGSSVALARDLSHTRPHKVKKQPKPALEAFLERARRVARLLATLPPTSSAEPFLLWRGDAQRLALADNSIDLIVTSPPYASNAIDYMRAHKFTLVWWGYPIKTLSNLRRDYIGGEALQGVALEPLPEIAQAAVAHIAEVDSRKGRVLHRYFSEMRRTLQEMARVLRPDGAAILVVGDATMRGRSTQTPQALAAIGQQVGLAWVGTGVRHLDRDRRMMPARSASQPASAIEQRMHQEFVLGFLKPGEAK